MPRTIILLPAKDAEATLARAVRSTLRAMPRDSELHLFDDGSTDSTLQVMEHLQTEDARVRVSMSPSSVGVARALNRLALGTDSEYLGRMDADDICLPWRFKLQLQTVESGHCDAVFSTVLGFKRGFHTTRPQVPAQISPANSAIAILFENVFPHSTLFSRRSVLECQGYYRDSPAEDYDLWLRALAAGSRLSRLGTPTLAYRTHDAQVTASSAWAQSMGSDPLLEESHDALAVAILGIGPGLLCALRATPRTAEQAQMLESSRELARQLAVGGNRLEQFQLRRVIDRSIGRP